MSNVKIGWGEKTCIQNFVEKSSKRDITGKTEK